MRIISKFQDYYDSALGYGVDMTQVLPRKTETIFLSREHGAHIGRHNKLLLELFIVGFCGEFFQGVKIEYDTYHSKSFGSDWSEIVYSREELDQCVKEREETGRYFNNDRRFNKLLKEPVNLDKEMFFEHKCPFFVIEHEFIHGKGWQKILSLWPCLKNYKFQKVKDPFTAFQEISQYYFGVIGCTEKDICVVSDKDRLDQRGFDPKYGFRKRPKEV